MKKILFSVNITEDKNNEIGDEELLVIKKVEVTQEAQIEKTLEETTDVVDKATLPLYLTIIKFITLLLWVIVLGSTLKTLGDDLTFAQMYHNAPGLILSAPVAFVIWLSIFIYEKLHTKKVENSEEYQTASEHVDELIRNSFAELGVPSDALKMDILGCRYKIKNDELKMATTGMTKFVNMEKNVYIDDQTLYIADIEHVIAVPLDSIKSIEQIDKKVPIPLWNKEDDLPNKGKYKQYKMTINQYGMIYVKPYYVVHITVDQQDYELNLPVYEYEAFTNLIGYQKLEN